jgi:lysine-specific histone demethylase 1
MESGRVTILLNHEVHQISYDAESKTCTVSGYITGQKDGGFTETGNCAVITVPLGVLKANKITFTPALPEWKTLCIQRMGMGMLEKVVLVSF